METLEQLLSQCLFPCFPFLLANESLFAFFPRRRRGIDSPLSPFLTAPVNQQFLPTVPYMIGHTFSCATLTHSSGMQVLFWSAYPVLCLQLSCHQKYAHPSTSLATYVLGAALGLSKGPRWHLTTKESVSMVLLVHSLDWSFHMYYLVVLCTLFSSS